MQGMVPQALQSQEMKIDEEETLKPDVQLQPAPQLESNQDPRAAPEHPV